MEESDGYSHNSPMEESSLDPKASNSLISLESIGRSSLKENLLKEDQKDHLFDSFEQSFSDFKFDETVSATFYGRRLCKQKQVGFMVASCVSLGFVYLLSRWLTKVKMHLLTSPCTLREATHIFVRNSFGQTELVPITVVSIDEPNPKFEDIIFSNNTFRSMDYRCNRFILSRISGRFISANDIFPLCLPSVEQNMDGLTSQEAFGHYTIIGKNQIEIGEKTSLQIFYNEILHPFYVFQVASFFIWLIEDYYLYAVVILIIATGSAILTVVDTKRNSDKMREMSRFLCKVKVIRDGKITQLSSEDLVPGDIIYLDENISTIPCDGILINGDAILDESMLTGETVPVTKSDINDDAYRDLLLNGPAHHQRSYIHSGTRLLRSRSRHGRPAMLLVYCTGFLTTKGSLVQSIMFPRPNNFRFYRDSMLFIAILSVIAALGFSVAIVNFITLGVGIYWIAIRALDVITVVVPPALPATMAIGTVFAIKRLEEKKIYCISPPRINVASKVNICCFDKTGTLTEEGLEILGILPVKLASSTLEKEEGKIEFSDLNSSPLAITPDFHSSHLLQLMATCHNLKRINHRLLGDSLDLKMFEFTGWELEEPVDVGEAFVPTIVRPPGSPVIDPLKSFSPSSSITSLLSREIGIVRQFDFSSRLRRMTVVTRPLSKESLYVYTKGSPESLLDICLPETIPHNYSTLLSYYAHHGYRVIGCAMKECTSLSWVRAQKMTREQAESDLKFLGFIIFENKLKPKTTPTIQLLSSANIRCIMATGDNILTGISVGRACHLIKEEWAVFYPTCYKDAKSFKDLKWCCVDGENVDFDSIGMRPRDLNLVESFSLAVSGDFFEWAHEHGGIAYLNLLTPKCSVYARMSPQQKQLLVEVLQEQRYIVGFCGDGANDCGALKAANVGVSLSQAEASVAASFTSKIQDISCMPELLKEGRASLVTSFCCFKYMTLYSMIQFTSLIFLYSYGSTLSDGQFVFVDLLLIVPLGILMSRYAPSNQLVSLQPTAKLISVPMLTSILGHICLQGIFQICAYYFLARSLQFGWESPYPDDMSNTYHPTTTVLFLFSSFQYLAMAVIFSAGRPFRQHFYWPFAAYSFIGFICIICALFFPPTWFKDWLYITDVSVKLRVGTLILAFIYFFAAFLFDRLAAPILVRILHRMGLGKKP